MFTPAEREEIEKYWAEAERYRVGLPANVERDGLWQVRLTPAGSLWLWSYDRARGLGKTPPNQPAPILNDEQRAWDAWIDARVAWDRARAEEDAAARMGRVIAVSAPDPGPIPEALQLLVGDPPPFAEAVSPRRHTILFHDGHRVVFEDNARMRPRYAYYRFREGVMHGGTPVGRLPEPELRRLMSKAGIDDRELRIMRAVSLLEGGFESVNTYDTGFVSIGFLQFASLRDGAGSLGQVMLRMKRQNPTEFRRDFRRFGLDVTDQGRLVAFDLSAGVERVGPEANQRIIRDRRFAAVFHRAGTRSEAFRLAQLREAMASYYPADDRVQLVVGDRSLTVRVGDVVRSEAGLATLMDRKVNTGKLDPLPSLLQDLVIEQGPEVLDQPALIERNLVEALVFRKNYLADNSLSQPRLIADVAARGGSGVRTGRGKR